jgi:hypothetical protein
MAVMQVAIFAAKFCAVAGIINPPPVFKELQD